MPTRLQYLTLPAKGPRDKIQETRDCARVHGCTHAGVTHVHTSKRAIRVLRISGRSSALSRPLAMPLATSRQDSCLSSFKMRGGWLSAALGKTLLWNSSFVYMDGGCIV